MGSGGKRKTNDSVRINLPQDNSGKGGGNGGAAEDINRVCPVAFEVRIKPKLNLPTGTAVSLIDGKELFVSGERVGELPTKYQEIIKRCASGGIKYSGRVINRGKDKIYARFEQTN